VTTSNSPSVVLKSLLRRSTGIDIIIGVSRNAEPGG
jgi:hypothetical protein